MASRTIYYIKFSTEQYLPVRVSFDRLDDPGLNILKSRTARIKRRIDGAAGCQSDEVICAARHKGHTVAHHNTVVGLNSVAGIRSRGVGAERRIYRSIREVSAEC